MTLCTRVIACLDVAGGRVVKGVNFQGLRDAGDPVELASIYNEQGIDELVFLDIMASAEERATILDVVEATAAKVFIPLTVGGGISSVDQVDHLLRAGADKVSINTSAIEKPSLLNEIGDQFGAQVIVLSIDTKRSADTKSGFELTTHGGTRSTGLDLLDWVERTTKIGIGEILLNSIDFDGTKAGFDLELIKLVKGFSAVPVIASGGAGKVADFPAAVKAGADAVLAASLFHFGEVTITEVKQSLGEVTNVRF
ncbi:MAG: imidazole glycerol phosphate synthase subunit HisF [Actinobacteria bacterium]|jgi:cyclase|uniref:imidazole glycerol-phosphate synthase n=1 Tax=freshwater metagenome TaxID=449393 RepID=A0A6J6F123_9ZZZZ|nr:imidazole glycerol phosphate synthase subunit HisF [Actinomycetota bacterium]